MTPEAFAAAVEAVRPKMIRIAKKIVGRDEAEDVVQNALLNMWQARGRLPREAAAFAAYAKVTVENAANDYIDALQRDPATSAYFDREETRRIVTEDDLIDRVVVRRVVESLPEDIRYAVWTVYAEGATWQDAAADLGVDDASLHRRVRKWLPYLREQLGEMKSAASPSVKGEETNDE